MKIKERYYYDFCGREKKYRVFEGIFIRDVIYKFVLEDSAKKLVEILNEEKRIADLSDLKIGSIVITRGGEFYTYLDDAFVNLKSRMDYIFIEHYDKTTWKHSYDRNKDLMYIVSPDDYERILEEENEKEREN